LSVIHYLGKLFFGIIKTNEKIFNKVSKANLFEIKRDD